MIIEATQRATKFIPRDDSFHPSEFDVSPICEKDAKDFCLRWHYSKSYPSARRRFGLFWFGQLVGVAVFSHPTHNNTITNSFDCKANEAIEMGRFVLLDSAPFNSESWFFARCRELLTRDGFSGIISFADDFPRTNAVGETIFVGHLGICYQASNGIYVGRGCPSRSFLLPDGSVLSPRAVSKVRNSEVGSDYVCRRLAIFAKSEMPIETDTRKIWFERELKVQSRIMRHPGNHKFLWKLDKAVTIKNESQPYPKISQNLIQPLFK